ncbi:MAG: hypothetical protein ACKVT0_12970, partial [Planctomycetaceae bacterium]
MRKAAVVCLFVCFVMSSISFRDGAGELFAAPLTKDQKKVIAEIKKEMTKVTGLVRSKKFDEADEIIKSTEEKLENLIQEADLKEDDKLVITQKKLIELNKTKLKQA